jgi:hypothetical protein
MRKCTAIFFLFAAAYAASPSSWVSRGADGKLQYRADSHGNRIMDFSCAGYKSGGSRRPTVAVARTVEPGSGDATARIQQAIDAVSHLIPSDQGLRGAVLLDSGTYEVSGTLTISAGGVVLRGSGSGENGTVLRMTGAPHRLLQIRGDGSYETTGRHVSIADSYVPSGADSLQVEEASSFHAGDTVLIVHPVTAAWIRFMGMDTLVRDGKKQMWLQAGSFIETDRSIRDVQGKRITLDAPLSDSIDRQYAPGASVVKYAFAGRISQIGVESLRVAAPALDVPISQPQYTFLSINAAVDSWVSDIEVQETENGISIGPAVRRMSVERVRVHHSQLHRGSAAPADFSISGTQILLDRCSVDGEGTWPVVTQARATGPIVILNFSGTATAGISPHQRWATGVLVDGAKLPSTNERHPGIAFSNRKTAGSGHGWDVGWAVAWNVVTPYFLVQQPPGAMNWCIGCVGRAVTQPGIPNGEYDSPNAAVEPASLYLAQLRERLGEQALANIGYQAASF